MAENNERAFWQEWAQKRVEINRKYWLRAADAALAGDMRELRTRVQLCRAEAMLIQLSATDAMESGSAELAAERDRLRSALVHLLAWVEAGMDPAKPRDAVAIRHAREVLGGGDDNVT